MFCQNATFEIPKGRHGRLWAGIFWPRFILHKRLKQEVWPTGLFVAIFVRNWEILFVQKVHSENFN